jgi:uncharacterized protein YodC (DUF2158 family)
MEARKFKPGDHVRGKTNDQLMEVVKYVMDHELLGGDLYSDHHVECVWFDKEKNRHKAVFDQRTLYLVEEPKEHLS